MKTRLRAEKEKSVWLRFLNEFNRFCKQIVSERKTLRVKEMGAGFC